MLSDCGEGTDIEGVDIGAATGAAAEIVNVKAALGSVEKGADFRRVFRSKTGLKSGLKSGSSPSS